MAHITIRRTGELVRGVFQILDPHPEGLPVRKVLEQLPKLVPPNDFEQTTYPTRPEDRRYEKIVRFSTIGAVKAGWMLKERGLWSLTDAGRDAFRKFSDPEKFERETRRLYREWAAGQPEKIEEVAEKESPDAATTLEEAEDAAWAEIQDHLTTMPPFDLQNLVAGLMRGMGYHVSWVSPPGPDHGMDILAHTDPLGIEGPRIKVQVKRRADRIAVEGVRSFLAVLADSDTGIFVSTGGFTRDAEDEARRQEKRRITLIDLRRLFELWVEYYDKNDETSRRLLPLKRVYHLAPSE